MPGCGEEYPPLLELACSALMGLVPTVCHPNLSSLQAPVLRAITSGVTHHFVAANLAY